MLQSLARGARRFWRAYDCGPALALRDPTTLTRATTLTANVTTASPKCPTLLALTTPVTLILATANLQLMTVAMTNLARLRHTALAQATSLALTKLTAALIKLTAALIRVMYLNQDLILLMALVQAALIRRMALVQAALILLMELVPVLPIGVV